MKSYITVKELGEFVFEDRKSRFLGFCAPVKNETEATDFINSVKKKYPDARHWVYAYVLRENSAMRYTDDREPQGTAGMPVLDVIRKNNCTDTVIVVVRYFGGTLLGTGGLVHAYTEAAAGALRRATVICYNVYTKLSLTVNYSDFQKVSFAFTELDFLTEDTEYSDSVRVVGTVPAERKEEFWDKITELCCGRVDLNVISEDFAYRE